MRGNNDYFRAKFQTQRAPFATIFSTPLLTMSRVLAALALTLAGCVGAADLVACQACTHSVTEIHKQVPLLKRTGVREGDKEMALGDALPTMCVANVFNGLASAPEMAAACKGFSQAGGAIEKALLAGQGASEACASLCEGVAEGERSPKPAKVAPKAAAPPLKPGKTAPRKGSVDDPAYKAALKKKAARDAARGAHNKKKRAAVVEEEEEEAEGGVGDL